jgi:hypothetical protein
MNEYEMIGMYAIFALLVFLGGVLWNKHREFFKQKFNMTHDRPNPNTGNPKTPHLV